MPGLGLRIKKKENSGAGMTGQEYTYVLTCGDQELDVTSGLTSLYLRMSVNEINNAQVSFYLDSVDVDASALAALQAMVEDPPDREETLRTGIDLTKPRGGSSVPRRKADEGG
jgi:hypothetical protein